MTLRGAIVAALTLMLFVVSLEPNSNIELSKSDAECWKATLRINRMTTKPHYEVKVDFSSSRVD